MPCDNILQSMCIMLMLSACSSNNNVNVFDIDPSADKSIEIEALDLTAIALDDSVSSYEIESGIKDGKLYVVDKYLCTLNFYDENGNIQSAHLGEGRAANETVIGQISGAAFMDNGELLIFNPSGIYMVYDDDLLLDRVFRIEYPNVDKPGNLYENPLKYTHRYNRLAMRPYSGRMYFNMELAHPDANIVESGEKYLREACSIAELDIDEKEYTSLLGKGFPKSYRENPAKKRIFSASYFDIDKHGNVYATYEADSIVYVFDMRGYGKKAFGCAGKDMDMHYADVNDLKESKKHYRDERQNKGYYNWIEYIDETDLLFRSYQKGSDRATDGLQIYRDGVLIADVSVPKGFKIAGYSAPYYYSKVIPDEDNEKLTAYRFRLEPKVK